MLRHGLLVTLLSGTACAVPNPLFDLLSEGASGTTDASTTTQGVTSEPTTGATSELTTDAPLTSTSESTSETTSESTGPQTTTEATMSEPEPVCGDDVKSGTEECDDGNQVDEDECTNTCTTPVCGDGIPQGDEPCDDNNTDNTDECLVGCVLAKCGDGELHNDFEECDDGNTDNTDECTDVCAHAKCGDGFIQLGEVCDDGPNFDFCIDNCTEIVFCNNNKLDAGEECDPSVAPFKGLSDLCDSTECTINGCFRVTNDKEEEEEEAEFIGNKWLDDCVMVQGQTVVVTLLNGDNKVTYLAKGEKAGNWTTDDVTAGTIVKTDEYDINKHNDRITMNRILPTDGKDLLMVTSQSAAQAGPYNCHTSLGDGYGVAIFQSLLMPKVPKLLVMGYKGGKSMNPREIKGFAPSTEISYKSDGMDVCGVGVTPFSGTFILSVFP